MRPSLTCLSAMLALVGGAIGCIAKSADQPPNLPGISGAVDPNVSPSNVDTTICVSGYARSVRPAYSITGSIKRRLMRAQHPGERFAGYELDHLVPLSLGGAPANPDNLWLEPWTGPMNATEKDALEFVLWRLVCSHEVALRTAQRAIAENWIEAYRRYATPQNIERFHFRHAGGD
jgi:hypothetical protein